MPSNKFNGGHASEPFKSSVPFDLFDDSYKSYIAHIVKYPRLSREREIELSRIIRRSRKSKKRDAAIREFVEGNLLLVVKFAMDYYKKRSATLRRMSISLMDIIAEGNIGLLRAVKAYDADHKARAKFSSFASIAILRSMGRGVVNLTASIHIPANVCSHIPAAMEVPDERDDELTAKAISKKLRVRLSVAHQILASKRLQNPVRLDESPLWQQFLPDKADIGAEIGMRALGEYLRRIFPLVLKPREAEVIGMMYFGGSDATLQDAGEVFKLSRERIRQIRMVAMRKLRKRIVGDWEAVCRVTGEKPLHLALESLYDKDRRSARHRAELGGRGGDIESFRKRDRAIIAGIMG